jgi:HD-GYP domain-containing protein (c-di-GMP phosphodiesterase class II)
MLYLAFKLQNLVCIYRWDSKAVVFMKVSGREYLSINEVLRELLLKDLNIYIHAKPDTDNPFSLFKGAGDEISEHALKKVVFSGEKFFVEADELNAVTFSKVEEGEDAVKSAIKSKDVKYMLSHMNGMLNNMGSEASLDKDILKKLIASAQSIMTEIMKDKQLLRSFTQYSIHDIFSVDHSLRVMDLMLRYLVGSEQNEDKLRSFGTAALLFDIGRLTIPKDILVKIESGQGKLSKKQFAKYREHPQAGYELLKKMGMDDPIVLKGALEHHRTLDHSSFIDKEVPTSEIGKTLAMMIDLEGLCYVRKMPNAQAFSLIGAEAKRGKYDKDICRNFYQSLKSLQSWRV